ncbi:hypothetical protein RclHR1_01570001 [Rhizophagus clarus]|nr:hypothetical protein RclHR1_01570001 [Rhizophagus clarus]
MFKSLFKKLKIFDKDTNPIKAIYHGNCYKQDEGAPWCKEYVPRCIIEGWTSGNNDIDDFIKETIYDARSYSDYVSLFLEWVPFDRFKDIKKICEGGFAKVYSATWIDGKSEYFRQDDGSWKKSEPKPMEVALKKLNESQNISADYLNELKTHWNLYNSYVSV